MSFTCGTCWRDFYSEGSREQHLDARGHGIPEHECDRCPKYFGSRAAVVQHMNDKNHWKYQCGNCVETWPTQEALVDHEIGTHLFCSNCQRYFTSSNNIKMHLNSHIHRGFNVHCPFCTKSYATAGGLSHHLENGSCTRAPQLDRDTFYNLVRSKDPNGLISKNLIGWHGSATYEANDLAWNGMAWECYFCHGRFRSRHSLNQHLASPAHQQALYHCPLRGTCGREFTTFAGLMNHLESESCGYTRFENVQVIAENLVRSDRRIGF
ncbi:hypothetical protein GGS23DRAFT_620380 [Durotheca rogersii]|uniref:uncharacterized protein n=1 Tax=Durotheca rogersii TaxID=419775 RepID=UPI00221FEA9C|nr:uncharacterized protein GGS23DRAFT_620380 [Durotheca rogersii]KAI5863606.1 hypothetical protein GGS23DRAFT_620380 [Durotheca rogersii]